MAIGSITTPSFTIERAFSVTSFVDGMTLAAKPNEWRLWYETNVMFFEIYEADGTRRLFSSNALSLAGIEADDVLHYLHLEVNQPQQIISIRFDNVISRSFITFEWSFVWRNDVTTPLINGNNIVDDPTNPWQGTLDEIVFYPSVLDVAQRDEIYNFWKGGQSGAVYGEINTVSFNDNFGLTQSVNSYRGKTQFRQNYRTSAPAQDFSLGIGDYAAGVPAPVVPPTVSVNIAGDPTALDTDTRFYLMTYVNDLGFESAPGPVSDEPVYVGESTIAEIAYPRFSDVAYEAAAYDSNQLEDYVPIREARIYRTNTGTSETGFQFVRAVQLLRDSDPQTTFTDVDNNDLGELLITDNWDVPPPEVTTGCKMANGTYLLAHDYRLHMSVPGVTYAFPVLYNRVLRHRALHLEAIGTSAVLLTDGGPYLIAGGSPDVMEVVELPFTQVPTSMRGVSTYLDLVIFPAQDGLIGIDANGRVTTLTEDIFEEDQWRDEIDLPNIISEVYDSVYYGFYYNNSDDGYRGFAFNLKTREWSWLNNDLLGSFIVTGMHYDKSTDSFYFADAATTELMEWQPHVLEFESPLAVNPFVDLDPLAYWPLEETTGTVFADIATNVNSNNAINSLDLDRDASNFTTTMPGGVGNAIEFEDNNQPGTQFGSVKSGRHSSSRTDPASFFTNFSDWTIFMYLTREDISAYNVGGEGGGYDFGDGEVLFEDLRIFLVGSGNEGPNWWSLNWIPEADELRLYWNTPDSSYFDEVLVSNFSSYFPLGQKTCFRFTGNGTTGVVTTYAGATAMGSFDISPQFTARGGMEWRFTSSNSFVSDGIFFGACENYTFGGSLHWTGKMDEAAYFDRLLTAQEALTLCAGPVIPDVVLPVPWQWVTKEFILPNRSYGAVKILGELDTDNSVEVTLELDGTDVPLFSISAGEAVGICTSERPFRLPAIRAQRMKLKLRTASGAPVIESIQISVHPMELV